MAAYVVPSGCPRGPDPTGQRLQLLAGKKQLGEKHPVHFPVILKFKQKMLKLVKLISLEIIVPNLKIRCQIAQKFNIYLLTPLPGSTKLIKLHLVNKFI